MLNTSDRRTVRHCEEGGLHCAMPADVHLRSRVCWTWCIGVERHESNKRRRTGTSRCDTSLGIVAASGHGEASSSAAM